MNFGQWKYRLANSMRGRYGMDALYKALLGLMVVFIALNLFFPSPVFYFLGLASGAFAFFRAFSRNTAKRAAENQKYTVLRTKTKQFFLQLKNQFRDRKTHRYVRCPSCRTTLRLPRKPGVNHVTCPVCKNGFDVTMR